MDSSQTLQSWFDNQYRTLASSGETAKAHLLRQSYFKTLEYSILLRSNRYSLTESGLITTCSNLYQILCWKMRIP